MKQPNVIKRVNDIMKETMHCTFTIITPDGYPHASSRSFCRPADVTGGYISSDWNGNLVQTLLINDKASICVRSESNNITLIGRAEIIRDDNIKKEMWLDWFIEHYKGIDDPEYTIIKFTTEKVSLYLNGDVYKFAADTFLTPVSYCGLMCTTCEYVESNNCKGCIATKGNPFYGECKIAKCAIKKGYEHCGQCDVMPCDMLYQYSFGEGEHCDRPKGSRLEVLKIWNR